MKARHAPILLALAIPLVACNPDPVPSTTDGAVTSADAGPITVPDSGRTRDTGVTPDRDSGPANDSFETARTVTTDGTAVAGAIARPGAVEYYRFEGTAGAWISINTEANPDDDPEMIDTVITLYDASHAQLAADDDAQPRVNTDSEIIIRLPATGTYFVKVEDYSSWITDDDIAPEGMPSFQYELSVSTLSAGGPLVFDPETGDTAADAAAMTFGGSSGNVAFVFGTFDDATDVDVFRFTMPGTGNRLLDLNLMPAGTDGYGSTRAPARVWVTNADGTSILARIEPRSADQLEMMPPLEGGTTYLLFVDAGGGTAGSNDHYVFKAFAGTENPSENEVTPNSNDTIADATALTMAEGRGFILATLPPSDVDVFSFSVPAGQQVSVYCGAQSSGSGLRGLSAKLVSADDTELASASPETPTDGASIRAFRPTAAGTYYLRLTAASQDAVVVGDYVRCGVVVAAPPSP